MPKALGDERVIKKNNSNPLLFVSMSTNESWGPHVVPKFMVNIDMSTWLDGVMWSVSEYDIGAWCRNAFGMVH